jgi:YbbR domain-containing protein
MNLTFRAKIKTIFTNDLGIKISSIFIAVVIWGWVQNTQITTTTARVKIDYIWPNELVRVEDSIQSIILTAEGPQGRISMMDSVDLRLRVDISDGVEGINPIDFSSRSIENLPQGVEIVRISPPLIEVELDKPMTREVPVVANLVGSINDAWEITSTEIMPSSVTISGPQSRIKNIVSIQTDPISVDGLSQSKTMPTILSLPASTIQSGWNSPIQVKLRLAPLLISKSYSDVPVTVREQSWTSTIPTVEVTLKGPQSYMEELSNSDLSILLSSSELSGTELELQYSNQSNSVQVIYPPNESVEVLDIRPDHFFIRKR